MWEMNVEKFDLKSAVYSIFPSKESFRCFRYSGKKRNVEIVSRIVSRAFREGLIGEDSEGEFAAFVGARAESEGERRVSGDYTFSDLIDEIRPGSINQLIQNVNGVCGEFGFPKLSAVMVSRLRNDFKADTSARRMTLRTLAFWIGGKRPKSTWNYEKILHLENPGGESEVSENEGVLLAVELQDRDGEVGFEEVQWLREELNRLAGDSGRFKPRVVHLRPGNIRQGSMRSFCLRLPGAGGKSELGAVGALGEAVKDAVCIAHQLSAGRRLWGNGDWGTALVVAVAAGEFSELEARVKTLLGAGIAGDPAVRLCEGACLCARFAELKIGFREPVYEKCADGTPVKIWPVYFFWHRYFNCLPRLCGPGALPGDEESYTRFREALCFPLSGEECDLGAATAVRKFPADCGLMMEVAKACFFRRMFLEANAVVSVVLMSEPDHPAARVMRMNIYLNLALGCDDGQMSKLFFTRAESESRVILDRCPEDPEIWAEIGLFHYGRAMKRLASVRDKYPEEQNAEEAKRLIVSRLWEAAGCFERANALSPSGRDFRCFHWLIRTHAMVNMMEDQHRMFWKGFYYDADFAFPGTADYFFRLAGWLGGEAEEDGTISDADLRGLTKRVLAEMEKCRRSVVSRSMYPGILYACAVFLWDFLPKHSVSVCKKVASLLSMAMEEAESLAEDNIGVFSCGICFSEVVSARSFLDAAKKAKHLTDLRSLRSPEALQSVGDDAFLEDVLDDMIDQKMLREAKLTLYNIDGEGERGGVILP